MNSDVDPRRKRPGQARLHSDAAALRRRRRNVAQSIALIDPAADQGAGLVVLPELCNQRLRVRQSRRRPSRSPRRSRAGPTAAAWAERAARHRLHIVAGICERDGDKLYNSAVVIGPDGYIGTFRKVHLWNEEALYFEPGDLGFPVFHTADRPHRRRHLLRRLVPRSLSAVRRCRAPTSSACRPTGCRSPARPKAARPWPTSSRWRPRTPTRSSSPAPIASAPSAASLSRARASSSATPAGRSPGRPAGTEEIILAEVDLGEARRKRNWNAFNQVLRDRRTDVYGEMLGSGLKPGWY